MSNGGISPLFLMRGQVTAYYYQQIELFGGAYGVIEEGLFDSALSQPQTNWCYNPAARIFSNSRPPTRFISRRTTLSVTAINA